MARMFQYATSFSGDLSSWNVGNVEDMSAMFASAASFNSDISGWDVSNVRYMPGMFNYAESLNQDIGDWDVSNRSEEHTSELQSRGHLVCRLLLEKKKTNTH